MTLLEGFEHMGHEVYLDNYYSSPLLYEKLQDKGIGASGTMHLNQKNIPLEQNPQKLRLCKGDPQHFMIADQLISCAWYDTKRVTFLSTIDNHLTVDKKICDGQSDTG